MARRKTDHWSLLAGVGVAVLAWGVPTLAHAGNYQTCIKIRMRLTDSGQTPQLAPTPPGGSSEANWWECGGTNGCEKIARGIQVVIQHSSGSLIYNAHPNTGCVDWTHPATSGFTLRVRSQSRTAAGVVTRVHDGGSKIVNSSGNPTGGGTYEWLVSSSYTPTNGMHDEFVIGAMTSEWNAVGTAAYVAFRAGLAPALDAGGSATINVGLTQPSQFGCLDATSNYSDPDVPSVQSTDFLAQPHRKAFFRVARPSGALCTVEPPTRRKFLIAHEEGHTLMRLFSDRNGLASTDRSLGVTPCSSLDECSGFDPLTDPFPNPWFSCSCVWPAAAGALTPTCAGGATDPGRCSYTQSGANCYPGQGRAPYSHREWSAYPFEEGFADFVSAYAFNSTAVDGGTYTWSGVAHDLVAYNEGAGTAWGGHLENRCAALTQPWMPPDPGFVGHATREDVQRLLWRWRVNLAVPCAGGVTNTHVANVYKQWRNSFQPPRAPDGWPYLYGAVNTVRPTCASGFNWLGIYHGVKN